MLVGEIFLMKKSNIQVFFYWFYIIIASYIEYNVMYTRSGEEGVRKC